MSNSGVKVTKSKVEAVKVFEGTGKTNAVHITQVTTKEYPSARYSNDKADGIFSNPTGEVYTSKRHALAAVPKNTEIDAIQKQLDTMGGACIYRITSNDIDDVLTDGDRYSLGNGDLEVENLKDKYESKNSEGDVFSNGEENNDGILPREYTRNFFSAVEKSDKDLRKPVEEAIKIEETADAEQFEIKSDLPF